MENQTNNTLPQGVLDAKAKGHTVFAIASDEGKAFYFRKPTKQEALLFQDNLAKSKDSISMTQEKLVRSLFCGDNIQEFDDYLNNKPFVSGSIFAEIAADMGLKENFTKTTV